MGDAGSILTSGRSPEEGNGNPVQYPCMGNPTDREAWRATIHWVTRVRHDLATKPPPPPGCSLILRPTGSLFPQSGIYRGAGGTFALLGPYYL